MNENSDHDFLPLGKIICHDAGQEGLAVLIETTPSPQSGDPYVIGFLLNSEQGKSLLKVLATSLNQKFPNDVFLE